MGKAIYRGVCNRTYYDPNTNASVKCVFLTEFVQKLMATLTPSFIKGNSYFKFQKVRITTDNTGSKFYCFHSSHRKQTLPEAD